LTLLGWADQRTCRSRLRPLIGVLPLVCHWYSRAYVGSRVPCSAND
jgi:hypothetical protein